MVAGISNRKHTMKTVRIQVLVPEDWRDAFSKQAAKSEQGLSEWLAELGKDALPKTVQGKLSERKGPGQPRKES